MAAAAPAAACAAAAAGFVGDLSKGKQVNADQTWTCDEAAIAEVVLALRSLGGLGAAGVDLSSPESHFAEVLECLEKQTSGTQSTGCLCFVGLL